MKAIDIKKLIGSLLVVGFEGTHVTATLRNFLEQWDLGGVILFKRNIQSLEQVAELNKTLYGLAQSTPIVSVDHEGGRVFRMPEPFTVFPPMRKVGEHCSAAKAENLAEQVGKIFAGELSAVGFNVDYAPVLDVDSNPKNPIIGDRAFSSDPVEVAKIGMAFLHGLQAGGVLACGKHFPGHGDTSQDSHVTLPLVEKSLKALEQCEFVPFRAAIQNKIPLLMTAHVLYPALDADWPATLSEKVLTDLLRKEMGYEGLILSDDFFMKGIAQKWSLEEAAERYLRIGGDLVMLCHEESAQRRVAAHLVHQAEQDAGFKRLVEEKAERMKEFRKRLRRGLEGDASVVGCEEHRKLVKSLG